MKARKLSMTAGAAGLAAAIALGGAPIGTAASVLPFGAREIFNDGMMATAYTVTNLTPSSDRIPWPVNGRLYEATVTVTADRGTIMPMIPWFNARAASGQTYRVLNAVATPQGLNPMSLAQGMESRGKIYFDVVGDVPNSVVFNDGAQDLLVWVGTPTGAAPEAPPVVTPPPPAAPMMPAPPPPPVQPMNPMMPGY